MINAMAKKTAKKQQNESASVRERAYSHIRQKIAEGALAPGGPISELTIAKELRISRTPIREAIAQLVSEGMLQELNRGVIVTSLERQDIIELYDLREALEVHAIGRVAGRPIAEADVELVQRMIDGILALEKEIKGSARKVLSTAQMNQFIQHDLGFHRLLIRLAMNSRVLRVMNQTRLLINVFALERPGYSASDLQRIRGEHTAILQAVMKRDPVLAMDLLRKHIQLSCSERLDIYDFHERNSSLREPFPYAEQA
jgi:DNA-binding GntR family transcriptional regulator